eukprot:CAMPEP_0181304024 /NCGR_PEP_ID=MMETSP1101-20121128/8905_1 /TAXON_ID=46948 /ORGANISM="Rhodomonas abbreviata, Strain Caron Lab Isolate" /LENGTH=106 /DNA_ID=CAMNT_0023409705 /DNA_START=36 /DNA_END=357 /DNA_ORIENTATION=+
MNYAEAKAALQALLHILLLRICCGSSSANSNKVSNGGAYTCSSTCILSPTAARQAALPGIQEKGKAVLALCAGRTSGETGEPGLERRAGRSSSNTAEQCPVSSGQA